MVLGNIFRDPIPEILAAPALAAWGKVLPDACAGCPHWDRCLGGCRAACEQLGAGLDRPDPLLWDRAEVDARCRAVVSPGSGGPPLRG